jgi:probable HAF family extracellular repeat protein
MRALIAIVGLVVAALFFQSHPGYAESAFMGLGDLPGGTTESNAWGLSGDGSTVVGYSNGASGYEAFIWTSGGGMVGLGDLAGYERSYALAASLDGSTVVGYGADSTIDEAFIWTGSGGMVGLGDLPGGSSNSSATDVSDDGSTVVGYSNGASGDEAFIWTGGGGMVGLGDLAGGTFESNARGVSADGSIVVGYSDGGSGNEAFIWDATNGMRELDVVLTDLGLDLTGWTLHGADDISDDGRVIAGYGTNPSGHREAWIAIIDEPQAVPTLSQWGLIALGMLLLTALLWALRRRQAASLVLGRGRRPSRGLC